VSEFLEDCRGEWRRLGVPDRIADEMAAELAADLEEAGAEGAAVEDVLGSDAFDAPTFAAAWAMERGVSARPRANGRGVAARHGLVAAIGALALVAIAGALLLALASPSGPTRVTLAPADRQPLRRAVSVVSVARPPVAVQTHGVWVVSPDARMAVAVPLPGADARVLAVNVHDSDGAARTIGAVLLAVGLAGIVPLTALSLWARPGRRLELPRA
jgi:hypothetical protein